MNSGRALLIFQKKLFAFLGLFGSFRFSRRGYCRNSRDWFTCYNQTGAGSFTKNTKQTKQKIPGHRCTCIQWILSTEEPISLNDVYDVNLTSWTCEHYSNCELLDTSKTNPETVLLSADFTEIISGGICAINICTGMFKIWMPKFENFKFQCPRWKMVEMWPGSHRHWSSQLSSQSVMTVFSH